MNINRGKRYRTRRWLWRSSHKLCRSEALLRVAAEV
jgi:hypothetical protein